MPIQLLSDGVFDGHLDEPLKIGTPYHGKVIEDALKIDVPDQPTTAITGEAINAGTNSMVRTERNPDTDQVHTLSNGAPLHQTSTTYAAGAYVRDSFGWVYKNIGSAGTSDAVAPEFSVSNFGDEEADGSDIIWLNMGEFVPVHTGNYLLTKFGVFFGDSATDNGMPEGCPLLLDYTPLAGAYEPYLEHYDGAVTIQKRAGLPVYETTPEESAAGKQWRNYFVRTGKTNIVANQELGLAHWIYFDDNNIPWLLKATCVVDSVANSVDISVYLVRVFGYFDQVNGYAYKAMNTLLDTFSVNSASMETYFATTDADHISDRFSESMGLDTNHDGSSAIFNIYSVYESGVNEYVDNTGLVQFYSSVGLDPGPPTPSTDNYRLTRLLAYFNISVIGAGNLVPDDAGDYGNGISASITFGENRNSFDNDPNYSMYPQAAQSDAYLKIKRGFNNDVARWLEARWVGYVDPTEGDFSDVQIVANAGSDAETMINYGSGVTINFPYFNNHRTASIIDNANVHQMIAFEGATNSETPHSELAFSYHPELDQWHVSTSGFFVNWA